MTSENNLTGALVPSSPRHLPAVAERDWLSLPEAPALPPARGWARIGLVIVVLGVGGSLLWANSFKLASGAYASGMVRLSDEKQTVSHVEGGIIRALSVAEGQRVEAGQTLVVLDDYNSETNLAILAQQQNELDARRTRLEALRDGATELTFPTRLNELRSDPAIADIMHAQERQFASEVGNIESQKNILRERVAQQQATIVALNAQIEAANVQLSLIGEEVESVKSLLQKGLERKPRLLALQRQQAALQSQSADYQGRIASSEKEISEVRMQMTNLEMEAKTRAVTELTDVQAQLSEVNEKLSNAQMRSRELTLRAAFPGTILNLRYRSAGAVVPPGQPILEIVPDTKVYVVDARIMPSDIDVVQPGLPAQIRLTGLKQRTHMSVRGQVMRVSSDALNDERTGAAYFEVRVAFSEDDLKQVTDPNDAPDGQGPRTLEDELFAGMPAEVTVVAHERTMLEYLFQPLKDSFAQAFHEG